ncbi:MAG: CO/xanthine dehydrogenase Mo-binding subunit [Alphaproteobacteria bacterium]|jgi:CO/xanthine dehydrogenase Mo-binding subunit
MNDPGQIDWSQKNSVVGKPLPRVDAGERVEGTAKYPADMALPGMLHAKTLRSPHAHAKIKSIDTMKAAALAGVKAIVTSGDFHDVPVGATIPMGEAGYDMWMVSVINIARDKVFWVGQPVAVVAATDPHIAEAALALIDVEYEALPAVMSIDAAMAPGAPAIHKHVITTGLEPPAQVPSNVCSRSVIERGNADDAISSAAASAAIDTTIDTGHQGYIEPQAMLAQVDSNGFATVWAATQGQHTTELMISRMLDRPQSRIKVVPVEIGGGFGGKISIHGEAACVLLSEMTGRPVKMVMSREEVFQGGSGPPAAARHRIEVAAEADGTLTAIKGLYRQDCGGLPGLPPSLMMQASAALYQAPNLHLEGYDVVTNKPRTEAYRGPGGIQAYFAMEQAMDSLCQKLDMDPVEFRKKNAAVTGSTMPIGTPFPSIGLTTILDAVGKHDCWTSPLGEGAFPRGRGFGLGYWRGTSMTSACHISISGDGRPMVTMGSADISGTRTTMAQVAAEQFELSIDDVLVTMGDTKSVGYSDGAAGSRLARTMAAAIVEASDKALAELRTRAGRLLQTEPQTLTYERGVFRAPGAAQGGASISLAEIMQATLTDGAILETGVSTKLPLGVEVAAHVADVEVDTDTGQVTVLRYTAFQDVGRALNPTAVEGQIEGSVVQGLGWALTESFDYGDDGRLRNASMLDFRMPTALDVPPVEAVIIETPVPDVPYGLRGVGEVPIVPVGGCVANAVARAIGARVPQMPMTPERVLKAVKGR